MFMSRACTYVCVCANFLVCTSLHVSPSLYTCVYTCVNMCTHVCVCVLRLLPLKRIVDLRPTDMTGWRIHCRVISKSAPVVMGRDQKMIDCSVVVRDYWGGEMLVLLKGSSANRLQQYAQLVDGKTFAVSGGIIFFSPWIKRLVISLDNFCGNVEEIADDGSIQDRRCWTVGEVPFVVDEEYEGGSWMPGELLNVVGVVGYVGDLTTSKLGTSYRMLKLVGDSPRVAWVFLNDPVDHEALVKGAVIMLKSVKRHIKQDESKDDLLRLIMPNFSSWTLEPPNVAAVERIAKWWSEIGHSQSWPRQRQLSGSTDSFYQPLQLYSLREVIAESSSLSTGAGSSRKYHVSGRIGHLDEDRLYYPSCTSCGYLVKLLEDRAGWHCARCAATRQEPEYRYVLNLHITDEVGDKLPAVAFHRAAEKIMGVTVDVLRTAELNVKTSDGRSLRDIIDGAMQRKWIFSLQPPLPDFKSVSTSRILWAESTD
eukprot:GHVS01053460.1.p1 GENE.GHVS01053460.1~~GHVS01053460.1.p1  ORF type:complete len:481 (-),score=40.52 GHVS01053460.1:64-1506(-)